MDEPGGSVSKGNGGQGGCLCHPCFFLCPQKNDGNTKRPMQLHCSISLSHTPVLVHDESKHANCTGWEGGRKGKRLNTDTEVSILAMLLMQVRQRTHPNPSAQVHAGVAGLTREHNLSGPLLGAVAQRFDHRQAKCLDTHSSPPQSLLMTVLPPNILNKLL